MASALEVFSRQGYAKASIREIARKAGISVGGVYLYFPNKERLYRSIITERMSEIGGSSRKAVEESHSATEALSCFLHLHIDHVRKHRDFILIHIREHGFAYGREEKKRFFTSQRKLVEGIIRKGIEAGEFENCKAEAVSGIIMALLRGAVLTMALDGEETNIKAQNLLEFTLKGIEKKRVKGPRVQGKDIETRRD